MNRAHDVPTDAELEHELRLMFRRHLTDVQPVAGIASMRESGGDADGRPATPGVVVTLPTPESADRPASRRWMRVAAAVVVLAGVAGVAAVSTGGDTGVDPASAPGGEPAVIWPLADDGANPSSSATPESAGSAYLADVGVPDDASVGATYLSGAEATVHYSLGEVPATLTLVEVDGRWRVTRAENDLVTIADVGEPDGDHVDVDVVAGSAWSGEGRLRAVLIDADGQVHDTSDVAFRDGEPDHEPGPLFEDGPWHTELFIGHDVVPAVVRVDVLSPDADTDQVVAHAAVVVPGAPDSATSPSTASPPATVDPEPDPLPTELDTLAAVRLPATQVAGEHDGPGLDGWEAAATQLFATARDTEGPLGPPTFEAVQLDDDGLVVQGRYTTPDGDAGTFELARYDDGDWGMRSLRSDELTLTAAGSTTAGSGSAVQIAISSVVDADLGVGGFRVGHVPGEPYIAAGDDAVFQVPCRDDGTATLFLLLHGADGTNLRFAEAWVC